ncbi:alkylmercury lyase family protein [Streptomyces albus]|uniref:alkylmercury lyase family protein n=1 Tax=Streptomyces albus TaxID=1888 RepID=UPI0033CB82BF
MPATRRPPRRDSEPSGAGMAAAGIGAAVLVIVCCAGPALIAAGALGALGGFLGNPWVIAAAVLLLAATVTAVVHRHRAGRDVCCPPTGQTDPAASSGRQTEPWKSAPSVSDLQHALDTAGEGECPPLDAAGRGGRGRLAPIAGGLRTVQQAVLRHFATTGNAPDPSDVQSASAAHDRTSAEVLADLAAEDFLTLDDHGHIRAAYPFSAVPTTHKVRLASGVEVWAMCAIDALGIPDMLDTDAVITSTDPVTGDTITVTSVGGQMTWKPPTAVVYVGQRSCAGPAADVACGALNFFTSRDTARAWAAQHPDHTGKAIDQDRAEALGRSIFGALLTAVDAEKG